MIEEVGPVETAAIAETKRVEVETAKFPAVGIERGIGTAIDGAETKTEDRDQEIEEREIEGGQGQGPGQDRDREIEGGEVVEVGVKEAPEESHSPGTGCAPKRNARKLILADEMFVVSVGN